MSTSHRKNILHLLAGSSSTTAFEAAKNLLAHGANPCSKEDDGLTPLHVACAWDSLAICQLLMHYGADPLIEDDFGRTPLDMATGKTQQFLQRLLAKGSQERRGILRRIFVCHSSCKEGVNNRFIQSVRAAGAKMRKSLEVIVRREINEVNQPITEYPVLKITNSDNIQHYTSVNSCCAVSQKCSLNIESNIPINNFPDRNDTARGNGSSENSCCMTANMKNSEEMKSLFIINNNSKTGSYGISSPTSLNPGDSDSIESYKTADESFNIEDLNEEIKQINVKDGNVLKLDDEREKIRKLLDGELRSELKKVGVSAGPICSRTRHIYEKKLLTQRRNLAKTRDVKFSRHLEMALKGKLSMEKGKEIDEKVRDEFKFSGVSSFCYLILDPRLMPYDLQSLTLLTFVKAIFYVGKGKKTRPLSHLILAKKERSGKSPKIETNAKLRRIDSIWSSNKGIICLQIHHNISDDEAFVREAALIEAISINNLTNVKNGEWHGSSRSWDLSTKAEYGVYLLRQAMDVLKLEGLREIYPHVLPELNQ